MSQWLDYYFDRNKFVRGNDHHFNLTWLLIMAVLLIFVGLGLRDPWPADEPRFAEIAKEMVDSGQWFFPMRGAELYPDKPPVFMWSIAIFYGLFGSIKLAFLLPSALSGLVTLWLVYDITRRLWDTQTAWYAGLLLLLSIQFVLQAKTAQIDAMVCCWITVGCYGLLRFLLCNDGWRWYALSWFFMGLGVITKGVGFLPLLMLLPYALVRLGKHRWRWPAQAEIQGGWKWLSGPLMLLFAISLWFIPMLVLVAYHQNPLFEQYRDNILFHQTVTRYAHSWHHIKPFYYYLVEVIPVFWLPLAVLLPWLVKPWIGAFKQGDRRIILPLCWIGLVLLFFSVSPGKRGVYILPALPMLAMCCAPYLSLIFKRRGLQFAIWAVVALLSAVLLSLGVSGLAGTPLVAKWVTQYHIDPWPMLTLIGLIGVVSCVLTVRRYPGLSWLIFIPMLWLIYSTWGYVILNPAKTPKNIYTNMLPTMPADAQLALIDTPEQFFLFAPLPVTHFGNQTPVEQQIRGAWRWQGQRSDRYLLVDSRVKTSCFDLAKGQSVGFAHGILWILLNNHSRRPDCPAPEKWVHEYDFQPGPAYQ